MNWILTPESRRWRGLESYDFNVVRNSDDDNDRRVEVSELDAGTDAMLPLVIKRIRSEDGIFRIPVTRWDKRVSPGGKLKD